MRQLEFGLMVCDAIFVSMSQIVGFILASRHCASGWLFTGFVTHDLLNFHQSISRHGHHHAAWARYDCTLFECCTWVPAGERFGFLSCETSYITRQHHFPHVWIDDAINFQPYVHAEAFVHILAVSSCKFVTHKTHIMPSTTAHARCLEMFRILGYKYSNGKDLWPGCESLDL